MRLAVVLMVMCLTAPGFGQSPGKPTVGTAATSRPPGWEATKARVMELGLDGKNQEMVALLEPIVAKFPGFVDGLFWLGAAHENVGRDLMRTNPTLAAARLETAASYYRRVYDLGGGEYSDALIRGLIDLYDGPLKQPATWKALILDARTRYAAEPIVHWYFAELLIREGRTAELPAGFKVARAALPAAPPDARLAFASLLTSLAEHTASIPVKTTIAAEAEAYASETLKNHPTGFYSRRAQAIKDDVARLRQTKGGD